MFTAPSPVQDELVRVRWASQIRPYEIVVDRHKGKTSLYSDPAWPRCLNVSCLQFYGHHPCHAAGEILKPVCLET